MSANVMELTDADFQGKVLNSDVPVLVDFWAEWCAPCKMVEPTIMALADDYEGRLKVARADTETCRDTAVKFDIRAIPTVMLFKSGEVVKKFVGVQPKSTFAAAIDEVLE